MSNTNEINPELVLADIRSKLAMRRGYASRIQTKLPGVKLNQIYAVAWGRKNDEDILEALMEEANAHRLDRKQELITNYLKASA